MAEQRNRSTPDSEKKEFVITRTFNAPRILVWKAWTEPERLTKWWGPKGMPISVHKFDLRPSGVFHYSMRAPDASDWWGKFVYRKIMAPEKIVFINSFSNEKGKFHQASNEPNLAAGSSEHTDVFRKSR